jgi:endonuclease-3
MKLQDSLKDRQDRANKVITTLKKHYPLSKVALNFSNPLELLIAVILSAQCTDIMVNKVTTSLFKKYKSLDDYVKADIIEFEKDIKPTGFYRAKAKNVLATAKILKEKFHGEVPKTMEELLTLSGVARKTANVVLGNAFHIVVGVAVDTHVSRLSQRLRFVDTEAIGGGKKTFTFQKNGRMVLDFKKDADPVKIEQELMAVIPKQDWFKATYLLVDHGRAVCKSQRPDCEHCVLNILCPSSRV